ncbi:SDR family NAD(P)-dependent oxidoreductase [Novosphingobium bradum]|uniref:SDR family NAD(P)-dependent oxidoreductase n=1 Tax=Novosphingobium bradum TaxID=1737444 RepID=A0ABV7IJE7_9SPHN
MNSADLFNLKGRVAMVTGAGQGVGRGIALALAGSGAGGVVVNDFYADRAEAVAEEIRALGVRAMPMVGDVGDLEQVRAGVAAATAELGTISILVNNAGNGGPDGFPREMPLFWETDPAEWSRFFHVNTFGVMNCSHAVLPAMVEQRYGRILTIVSDAGRTIEGRQAAYAAAKAAAAGLMRGIAADTARFGITANSIAISSMRPPMNPEQLEAYLASDRYKAQMTHYTIRRTGLPEDIAGTALLLCSDASSWTTGQVYPVDGGYSSAL